jgi:hypothetical protein
MANARCIQQSFFNEPSISDYSINERYFLFGLACASDDYGRFWWNTGNLKSILFPTIKNISEKWIQKTLEKYRDDEHVCEYEEEGLHLGHFPKWFTFGWFLKQRIDHPKEFGRYPDCPSCKTGDFTRKRRETSRAIQSNLTQYNPKIIQVNENELNPTHQKEYDIRKTITGKHYYEQLFSECPDVWGERYTLLVDKYMGLVAQHEFWDKDHKREFKAYVIGAQEKYKDVGE